ncbi:hypothetical protein DdX_07654 [Ditylenchus destructor]|uniref:Uncharacterized protein n=1 Tax=Ditylenchus destructor TaxID=166010 RepID=A0AAD4N305_9BILA|nr:hypothetical protein DdX_07654 [Ditylenchus destructor]
MSIICIYLSILLLCDLSHLVPTKVSKTVRNETVIAPSTAQSATSKTSPDRTTSTISNGKDFWNNIFKGVWVDHSNSQNSLIQQIHLIDAKIFKEDANGENDVDFQEDRIILGLQNSFFYPLKPFNADNFLKVLSSNLPNQPSVVEIQQPAEMNQHTKALLEQNDDTTLIYAHIFYTFKRCIAAEERK